MFDTVMNYIRNPKSLFEDNRVTVLVEAIVYGNLSLLASSSIISGTGGLLAFILALSAGFMCSSNLHFFMTTEWVDEEDEE